MDTFTGNMLVSLYDTYVLVDMGATYACISEEFMPTCGFNS